MLTGLSWGQQRKDHFDDLGIGGWTLLKWVLNMGEGVERQVAASFKRRYDLSDSMKRGEYLAS
jgi:hypothetical protein